MPYWANMASYRDIRPDWPTAAAARASSSLPASWKHEDISVHIRIIKHDCHNSGHHPSSCHLFKIRRFGDWILSPSSSRTYSVGPNR
jgi:hypothetical protein